MTQEQREWAARVLTENEEARVILARLEEEFHGRPMIADALMRGRKALESIRCLDPETGLMPCGCGGKAQCCGNSGDYDCGLFDKG